jgi:hypothetical protein
VAQTDRPRPCDETGDPGVPALESPRSGRESCWRSVKAWKFYNNVPISSFYLEMRVAEYCSGEPSIVYRIDLHRFLTRLTDIGLARMNDPMGICGPIYCCQTDAQLTEIKSKLATGLARAKKASDAEGNGQTKEAFEWYALLYDKKFPSYYY